MAALSMNHLSGSFDLPAAAFALLSLALYFTIRFLMPRRNIHLRTSEKNAPEDIYNNIIALPDFQWQQTEPLKIYSFKPKYHLTMGVETLTLSDLVAVDKTYLDRINLRRSVMADNAHATLACNDVARPAVAELSQWMLGTYLPRRHPTMFALDKAGMLKNLVTSETLPVGELDPVQALRNLGAHVDTDFLILLPSSTDRDGQPIYHLEAFVTCFPSGFSTRSKLSKPLAEIHKPVPGYAKKLERSMDRYFARIDVGTIVKRSNWTITTTEELFVQAGTHLYTGDADTVEREREGIVLDRCRLRCERQTLHRLPRTKALVFAFKTYQYQLDDVKADGSGPALAEAIEGLANGSVPEMYHYKRGVVWGDIIAGHLRSS